MDDVAELLKTWELPNLIPVFEGEYEIHNVYLIRDKQIHYLSMSSTYYLNFISSNRHHAGGRRLGKSLPTTPLADILPSSICVQTLHYCVLV